MKKEFIWNTIIVLICVILVFIITFKTVYSFAGVGSFSLFMVDTPFGSINVFRLGLIVGVVGIVFRYLVLGIETIVNKDLRSVVFILFYLVPVFLVLLMIKLSQNEELDDYSYPNVIPVEKLSQSISNLQDCGFFEDFTNEDAVSIAVGRYYTEGFGYMFWNYKKDSVYLDELLRLDIKKTWIRSDLEFALEGNNEYVNSIKELSSISNGNFKPVNVSEEWDLGNKKVKVGFLIEEEKKEIILDIDRDWADVTGLLIGINKIIKNTGFQFYYGPSLDLQVVGLKDEEFDCLQNKCKISKPKKY